MTILEKLVTTILPVSAEADDADFFLSVDAASAITGGMPPADPEQSENSGDEGDEANEGNEDDENNEGNEGNEGTEGDEGDEGNESNEGNEPEATGDSHPAASADRASFS